MHSHVGLLLLLQKGSCGLRAERDTPVQDLAEWLASGRVQAEIIIATSDRRQITSVFSPALNQVWLQEARSEMWVG